MNQLLINDWESQEGVSVWDRLDCKYVSSSFHSHLWNSCHKCRRRVWTYNIQKDQNSLGSHHQRRLPSLTENIVTDQLIASNGPAVDVTAKQMQW